MLADQPLIINEIKISTMNMTNNLLADRNDDRGDDKQKGLNFKLVELRMKPTAEWGTKAQKKKRVLHDKNNEGDCTN